MKKICYVAALAIAIGMQACKKNDDAKVASTDVILDASTGWKRVQVIPYIKPTDAKAGNDGLVGYDITQIGNEIGVLYSARLVVPNNQDPIERFYKIKFKDNDVNLGNGTALSIYASSKRATFHSQFIPNTLSPVFTNYAGSDNVEVYDENDTKLSTLNVENAKSLTYRYTTDGEFLMAGYDDTFYSHYWNFKYPQILFRMLDTKTPLLIGNITTSISIPMKLNDGSLYKFCIGRTATDARYNVLKLFPERAATATPPNYEVFGTGVIPNISPTDLRDDYSKLITYYTEDDVLTFVMGDYVVNNPALKALHCYRWNKRTNALTTLWENSAITANLSKAITGVATNQDRIKELRLTPDGTFYTLYTKTKYGEPNAGIEYTILYTVNATGIKELGKVGEELRNQSCVLTNARYFNGGYYALLYPQGDATIKNGDPRFHLELVKLTP